MAGAKKYKTSAPWNCDGGGKAHARTLIAAGYRCTKRSSDFYILSNGTAKLTVQRKPRLDRTSVLAIQVASGLSKAEYKAYWRAKAPLNCPEAA